MKWEEKENRNTSRMQRSQSRGAREVLAEAWIRGEMQIPMG